MQRKIPRLLWLALPLAYLLYFYHLGSTGVLGPDEPRYASIGHDMARSGDWITPRLWGSPWFEKPALLYWMIGAGFRAGLNPNLAPRVPVALLAVGFLLFFWWILNREFGRRVAGMGALILGTTVGWQALGQVGVTDLPLAATFAAAMLLTLPWIGNGDKRLLPLAAGVMGLAVLAKGPAPLLLALPLALQGRRLRDLLSWRVVTPFTVVAAPWYLLCLQQNGASFWKEFFLKQNLERYTSAAVIQHGQPWWFFVPLLAAGLLPWLPLAPLAVRRRILDDPRKRFLAAWAVWVVLFFSLSANKLPAYILPMLPAAAALLAIGLDETPKGAPWLAACAVMLAAFPVAAPLLPGALEVGLSHAGRPVFEAAWLYPLVVVAGVWLLEVRGRRVAAVACVAVGTAFGSVYIKQVAEPALERMPSPAALWDKVAPHSSDVCLDHVNRNWSYGLNYYAGKALPECSEQPKPWQVRQIPGHTPRLAPPEFSPADPTPVVHGMPQSEGMVDPVTPGSVPSRIEEHSRK